MISKSDSKENWESKLWFRLSKVVYIFSLLISLLIVGLWAYFSIPSSNTYNDSDKTIVRCSNGKSYNAKNNSLYFFGENNLDLYDRQLKSLCAFGKSDLKTALTAETIDKLPIVKNYSVQFFKTTSYHGSWEEVLTILLVGITIVIVTFEIIKRVFLYITIGKNPIKINEQNKYR